MKIRKLKGKDLEMDWICNQMLKPWEIACDKAYKKLPSHVRAISFSSMFYKIAWIDCMKYVGERKYLKNKI